MMRMKICLVITISVSLFNICLMFSCVWCVCLYVYSCFLCVVGITKTSFIWPPNLIISHRFLLMNLQTFKLLAGTLQIGWRPLFKKAFV